MYWFRRATRALSAAIVLAALLAGIPLALLALGGNPLHALADFVHAPLAPDDGTLFLAVFACVGWAAWALFALSVVVEIPGAFGRRTIRLPGLSGPQWLAGVLLATILTTTAASTLASTRAAATPAAAPIAAVSVLAGPHSPANTPEVQAPVEESAPHVLHVVQRGEVLLDLAERYYGDPAAISRIASANVGITQPDGRSLQPGQTRIYAGWTLRIPTSGTTSTTAAAPVRQTAQAPTERVYVVRDGDNLTAIAHNQLGDGERWHDIYALNQGVAQADGGALNDPDLIFTGWHLTLPTATTAAAPEPVPTVQPPAPHPVADTPAPVPPAPPATNPAPVIQAPTTAPPSASTSPTATEAPTEARQHDDRGVSLPSGAWVTLGLAAAVASAVTLLRLHRRRRALPRWPIPLGARPDRLALPASVGVLEAAGRSTFTDHESATFVDPDGLPAGVLPPEPTIAASIGMDADGEQVSLLDAAAYGLALVGPGAPGAARAMIAAVTSAGTGAFFAHQGHLAIPGGVLAELLPADAPAVGLDDAGRMLDGERLHVHASTDEAVAWFEAEMLYRRRVLDMHDATTYADMTARDGEALSFAVLVVPANDVNLLARVHAVAEHGPALRMATVVLGEDPHLSACHIAPDGTTTGAAGLPARLAVLTATDLADVLAVLRLANINTDTTHNADLPDDWDDNPATHTAPPSAVEVDTAPAELPEPVVRSEAAAVRLVVLGRPTLTTQQGEGIVMSRTYPAVVLAMLAAYPQGRTLEQLAEEFYKQPAIPTKESIEVAAKAANDKVRAAVGAVRSALRGYTGVKKAMYLLHDTARGVYRLDGETLDVDLWDLINALHEANHTEDEATQLAALQRAVAAYGGQFATGIDRPWANEHAADYHHQILSALVRIAELTEADQPDTALAALETALTHDPVSEDTYQRMMRIQGRQGHPDAVRRTLSLCESRLAGLETEPSAATRRIAERQLRASAA